MGFGSRGGPTAEPAWLRPLLQRLEQEEEEIAKQVYSEHKDMANSMALVAKSIQTTNKLLYEILKALKGVATR